MLPKTIGAAICIIGMLISVFGSYSCASTQLSPEQKGAFIQRLKAAKKQDEEGADDRATDPGEVSDFLQQEHKADRAIRELQSNFAVPQAEIEEALEVPPKAFSKTQRAEIIQNLKRTKERLEERAQRTAEDDDMVESDLYEEHEEEVDEVIKNLEIGEDVPWSTIRDAMDVPGNL